MRILRVEIHGCKWVGGMCPFHGTGSFGLVYRCYHPEIRVEQIYRKNGREFEPAEYEGPFPDFCPLTEEEEDEK
jgi:hypothetical protein